MPMSPRTLRPRASGGYGLDAADWRSRVIANGGTVSASTMKAVDDFCKAIVTKGLRDRFYRLNLFCGDFTAALVPLFRGPSLTGTQYGNATDTNNNFVSGDYVETGAAAGLKGNGSNKWLTTGTDTQWAGTNDFSMSCYVTEAEATAFRVHIGANQTNNGNSTLAYLRDGAVRVLDTSGASYTATPSGIQGTGLHGVTRVASNDYRQFYNSTLSAVSTNQTAASRGDRWLYIFANNNATNASGATGTYSNARLAAYHIGLGLTSLQVTAFDAAMQAFQTALGRNV